MGLDRKRRRIAARQRFKVYAGGKKDPPVAMGTADRLGAAVHVLVQQFRSEPKPIDPAHEVRVLLDVAAHLSRTMEGCDAEQFANVAAFVYEEMEKNTPPAQPPEAG